jgi:hypothetical protein
MARIFALMGSEMEVGIDEVIGAIVEHRSSNVQHGTSDGENFIGFAEGCWGQNVPATD